MTTNGQFTIAVEDVEYLRHGDKAPPRSALPPPGPRPLPYHGRASRRRVVREDPLADKVIHEPLAKSGVMVAALDFRSRPSRAIRARSRTSTSRSAGSRARDVARQPARPGGRRSASRAARIRPCSAPCGPRSTLRRHSTARALPRLDATVRCVDHVLSRDRPARPLSTTPRSSWPRARRSRCRRPSPSLSRFLLEDGGRDGGGLP